MILLVNMRLVLLKLLNQTSFLKEIQTTSLPALFLQVIAVANVLWERD